MIHEVLLGVPFSVQGKVLCRASFHPILLGAWLEYSSRIFRGLRGLVMLFERGEV